MSTDRRTNFTDQAIKDRHRLYGGNVPAQDLDSCTFIEYDSCEPVALWEWKHWQAAPVSLDSVQIKTLVRLAERASLPAFGLRYDLDGNRFGIAALNSLAAEKLVEFCGASRKQGDEGFYVSFLYHLRSRAVPPDIKDRFGMN